MVRALIVVLAWLWAGTLAPPGLAHVPRCPAKEAPLSARPAMADTTRYGFDAVDNLQTVTYPIGPAAMYAYDARNRLLSLAWQGAGGSLARYGYTLGPAGNRLGLAETNNGTARTYTWAYDTRYRLTNEAISATPAGTLAYAYDLVGNRLTRAVTGGVLTNQTLGFDSNDRLSGVGVQYDAAGNTTNDSARAYLYDWANRITNASNPSVSVWYDGDGNRIKKVAGGVTTLYLVATVNPTGYPQVVEELTVSGGATNVARRYTCGLDLISQIQGTNGALSYYGYDGLGSVRFLVNNSGSISDTYTYDAYGTEVNSTGSTTNWYRYTGEQCDPDLGMYYLRARYLSPGYGRFWTMDSFEGNNHAPLSLHKYLYAQADPVSRIDPSGHDGEISSLVTTMGNIGMLAGRTYAAVNNAYWMSLVRLTPAIEKGWQMLFWADVAATTAGAAATIAPEALNLVADLGARINRAYSMNATAIPPGWGAPNGYGSVIENIGGQELEAMGGKYVGGNVKGIDRTLGIGQGNVLVSFKAHDVAEENLIQTIKRDMGNLSALDPETIKGTTVGGKPFQFEGAVSGRVAVIAVPQSQARYIISPQFINAMRQLAEETKTVPIIRAVRNWSGRSR
jgi:RHS repeat-associated protein